MRVLKAIKIFLEIVKNIRMMSPGYWYYSNGFVFNQNYQSTLTKIVGYKSKLSNKTQKLFKLPIQQKNTGQRLSEFHLLFMNRENRIKKFDLVNGRVHTKIGESYNSEIYGLKRSRLKKFANIIEMKIDPGKREIIEEYIDGQLLRDFTKSQIHVILKDIINDQLSFQLNQKLSQEKLYNCKHCFMTIIQYQELSRIFIENNDLSKEEILAMRNLKWIFDVSHGDLSETNIIIDSKGIFFILDVDPRRIALRPIWYDILYLMGRLGIDFGQIENNYLFFNEICTENVSQIDTESKNILVEFVKWIRDVIDIKYPKMCMENHF